MLKKMGLLKYEVVRIPVCCIGALTGGFLLASGRICGAASPLPAVLAGVCHPLYSLCVLLGSLLAYIVQGAPDGMHFALAALVSVLCVRILFYEAHRPHVLAMLTAMACVAAGAAVDYLFRIEQGRFPLFVMEAMLIGIAVYFLADAAEALRSDGKIRLDAGKSFTFAVVYLLAVTALCGLDLGFCNAGRAAGVTITLLAARQYHQNGGTLLGALTACGTVLCSVGAGMPLLFLPVTAMLAGFLHKLPNAVFIPVFFLMQGMSAAVLDSSMELAKILVELLLACCVYGLCSRAALHRLIVLPAAVPSDTAGHGRQEQFLSETLADLRNETAAVLRHLKPAETVDAVQEVRSQLCSACKNEAYCWKQRRERTEQAFRMMLHHPEANPGPEALDGCIRRSKMTECFLRSGHRAALMQSRNVQLAQNRSTMLEYLSLLEEMTAAAARRREHIACERETAELREIMKKCGCGEGICMVQRLKSGRYTAQVYAASAGQAAPVICDMLTALLEVPMCSIPPQKTESGERCCFYEQPPYSLEYAVRSVTAPAYKRCGDTARAFLDGQGNPYLVLSDGMGSGSAASLISELAVRTFSRLVCSGMEEISAIRLVNTMLLSEMNTEHFATLDVLRMDADSGELILYKSGAAATLLQRGKQVMKITAPSFPIGILPTAEPFCKRMTVRPGDRIVMLSDGIHEAEYPYIKELLLRGEETETLLQEICSKAGVFRAGAAADDMTVIAAEICCRAEKEEKNCNWEKNDSTDRLLIG